MEMIGNRTKKNDKPKRKRWRVLVWTVHVLLLLLTVWILFNQFDARPDPHRFTRDDLPQGEDRPENGYWLLWALGEPIDVDITSPDIRRRYQKMVLAQSQRDEEGNRALNEYSRLKTFDQAWGKIKGDGGSDLFLRDYVHSRPEVLDQLPPELITLKNRISLLIKSPYFAEQLRFDLAVPIPNFLLFIRGVRLYTAMSLQKGFKGEWSDASYRLLELLAACRRIIKNSCDEILGVMFRMAMQEGLLALSEMMNQRACPVTVFEAVLSGMGQIQYEEYGLRQFQIYSALVVSKMTERGDDLNGLEWWPKKIVYRLLLQRNRTINEIHQRCAFFVERDEKPPYLWTSEQKDAKALRKPIWRWLQNPIGQSWFVPLNQQNRQIMGLTFRVNQVRVLHDLLRLSAWLHLQYDGRQTVPELLARPDCPELIDPGSGGPYRWNEEKQLVYGIGIDGEDNGGITLEGTWAGSDFSLPVVLFIR